MKNYFKKLYTYNQWCNQALVSRLSPLSDVPSEVIRRLSHIVAAEEIWYHRIKPLSLEPLPLFEIQSWKILTPRLKESAQRWLELVDHTDNYQQLISYHTTSGTPYQTSLDDILIHLAHHGSYHRGQMATLLRQAGLEPVITDYIAFCRL